MGVVKDDMRVVGVSEEDGEESVRSNSSQPLFLRSTSDFTVSSVILISRLKCLLILIEHWTQVIRSKKCRRSWKQGKVD